MRSDMVYTKIDIRAVVYILLMYISVCVCHWYKSKRLLRDTQYDIADELLRYKNVLYKYMY
jgi:hypothetical protein